MMGFVLICVQQCPLFSQQWPLTRTEDSLPMFQHFCAITFIIRANYDSLLDDSKLLYFADQIMQTQKEKLISACSLYELLRVN